MVHAAKHLPGKHYNLSWTVPRTQTEQARWHMHVISVLRRQRQADSWGSLGNHPIRVCTFQVSKMPHLKKKAVVPEEPHLD